MLDIGMMRLRFFLAAVAALGFFHVAGDARADCAESPAPRVNWSRCLIDGRDLSDRDLSQARIAEASFQRGILIKTNLSGVNGYRTKFISADLSGAVLDNASFIEADFTKANLSDASLKNADLRRARFFQADLRNADLSGARTMGADLGTANLSGVLWTDGKRRCAEGSVGQCN